MGLVFTWNTALPEEPINHTFWEKTSNTVAQAQEIDIEQILLMPDLMEMPTTTKTITEEDKKFPLYSPIEANVVLHLFDDFFCHYCEEYSVEIRKFRYSEILSQTKIALQWHILPIGGEDSMNLAKAVHCAGEQDIRVQWGVHDQFMTLSEEEKTVEKARKIIETYGLDAGAFDECYASEKAQKKVEADIALAKKMKIDMAPTLIINDTKYIGVMPVENIEWEIRKEVKK